jgi:HupE / UreJ protein
MKFFPSFVIASLMLCVSFTAQAHKPSDSYVTLNVNGQNIQGQWDIALRDLDFAIGLDADGDGQLIWDEVRAKHRDIAALALSHLGITSEGAVCATVVKAQLIDDHTDGAYSVLRFDAACPQPISQLTVEYRLFFDLDPQHKGLLKLQSPTVTTTAIFSPATSKQAFSLTLPSRMRQFFDFVVTGVGHIWLGFDHILFLLSLLLPAVLVWKSGQWHPAERMGSAALEVLKVISAFTLAHSMTLTLATLQVIALPSRWVESAIALSVVFAALNNIYPLVLTRRWVVAFGFGLIHGFGFASALSDLNLPQDMLLLALVGFNVGVEMGQLAIVVVFMPLAYAIRGNWLYRRLLLVGGSLLVALVASVWLAERVFNLKIIPG